MEQKLSDYLASSPEFYNEPFRPSYHFSPRVGHHNDPNGLIYFQGEFHMFYQHYPYAAEPGPPHWGHAVSRDMVHWEELPVALHPGERVGNVWDNIYSGTVVIDEQNTSGFFDGGPGMVAIYTYHVDTEKGYREAQSIAYSRDRGRTWTQYERNPVLPAVDDKRFYDYRDPKVFWHEPTQRWVMAVGGGIFRFYSSPNLLDWTFESELPFYEEFPDLFELPVDGDSSNKKWVLSMAGYGYYLGSFDGKRFTLESEYHNADFGYSWQAAYIWGSMPEGDERTVWLAWMSKSANYKTWPWRCNMSIPRELELKTFPEGIRMVQRPISELKALRSDESSCSDMMLLPGENPLAGITGNRLEIIAEFEIGKSDDAHSFGLKVLKGGAQETVIGYVPKTNTVYVDLTYSDNTARRCHGAYMTPNGERVSLHVFLDVSAVETFANDGRVVFTNSIYPDDSSIGMEIFSEREGIRLADCRVYKMKSIWDNLEQIDKT